MSMPGEVLDQTVMEGGTTSAPIDTSTPTKELFFMEGAASAEKDPQNKKMSLPRYCVAGAARRWAFVR